jgi:hypothetical protein
VESRKDFSHGPGWDPEHERYFVEVCFPDGSRKKKRFRRQREAQRGWSLQIALVMKGVDLEVVQKLLGHRNISNDAKVCPAESSVFERAGESTRQEVAEKWPFGRITKRHKAASGGKVTVLEKLHKDEAQRAQLGPVQTQLEHQMPLKV